MTELGENPEIKNFLPKPEARFKSALIRNEDRRSERYEENLGLVRFAQQEGLLDSKSKILTKKQRVLVSAVYREGKTPEQAAQERGVSRKAVYTAIGRALERLRKQPELEPYVRAYRR